MNTVTVPQSLRSSSRVGSAARVVIVLLMVVAAGAWAAVGGVDWFVEKSAVSDAILVDVTRGDFELVVTERGEIGSAGEIEVRSEVQSPSQAGVSILRIVPEGSLVDEGDFLVELDSSALQNDRTLQQIAVNSAEALLVEAKNIYETAVIARREYLEGTFVQERELIESELFVAEENLSRAVEYFEYSKKLAAKGYVNEQQLQADRFAVEKARKEADAAKTKMRVLENFTREKMLKQLDSDILTAKAKWEAEQNSLKLEVGKLAEIDDQITKCLIRSPRAGLVKFSHTHDKRGNADFIVEEGATIRERQVILTLPDGSEMQVELKVNESLVQYVQPGMAAEVSPVGVEGAVFRGVVERVNQYAEPTGWRKGNVKEYKAYVRIQDSSAGLRSGMTASVAIRSISQPDVLQVPVQAVYLHGNKPYCFVADGKGNLTPQPIECGPTNDNFYVVTAGLDESQRVAVNPRALVASVSLPEIAAPAEATERPAAPSGRPPAKKPADAIGTTAAKQRLAGASG